MTQVSPDLSIRARPRAVRRFSRKALLGGGAVLATLMFAALAVALQSPDYDDADTSELYNVCLLYTSPSPRDRQKSRMPSSA